MKLVTLPSPGKLNLFLHIVGRRADGYHNLQSVIQFFDYCDQLQFELYPTAEIKLLNDIADVAMENNLIFKAATLLQKTCNSSQGVTIQINKRLPLGAGIGGGSSNAATTLLALNKLWQLNLSLKELCKIGVKLGADVPLFIMGHSAEMQGIGDILTPIDLPEPWYVIVVSPVHVSTVELYNHPELTRNTPLNDRAKILQHRGHNDFEALVTQQYPVINEALHSLKQFSHAQLTGSGSAIFAAFASEAKAREVAQQLPASNQIIVARGCNVSPAHQELKKLDC